MKTLLALFLGLSGLAGTLLAESGEETNGKLRLGDPIPAVTARVEASGAKGPFEGISERAGPNE